MREQVTDREVQYPNRRLMVVAYYFPPMGLSGVQRIAKFIKYLPEFGWTVDVLTVTPGGYFAYDETLLEDVRGRDISIYRTSSLDPTRLFGSRNPVPMPNEDTRRRLSRVSELLFQPDNKIGWIPFALHRGRELLGKYAYDAVLSTAPPYTAHLIARRLAGEADIPHVADFRDDWVGNPRHTYPTAIHRWISTHLEWKVLRDSRAIITINESIARSLYSRSSSRTNAAANSSIHIIPQGYDPADFTVDSQIGKTEESRAKEAFTLLYTGVFYDAQRPDTFLRALSRFLTRNPDSRSDVCARFVGLVPDYVNELLEHLSLTDIVELLGYRPHNEVVVELINCSVCWMTIGRRAGADGISTGKLFEYMGSRHPILALIPDGEARRALAGYGASFVCDPDDEEEVADAIEQLYNAWRNGTLPVGKRDHIRQFNRRHQTHQLSEILSCE